MGCSPSGRLTNDEIDRACALVDRCGGTLSGCVEGVVDARALADARGCTDEFAASARCVIDADQCTAAARCVELDDALRVCAARRPDAGSPDAGPPPDACVAMCGSACVDTSTDPAHCGGCDRACGSGRCAGGVCADTLPGDTCETAVPLATREFADFDLFGYALDYPGILCGTASATGDYVHRWTAPTSETYEIFLDASAAEHVVVGVFGADCAEAGRIACESGLGFVLLTFVASAGTEYRIVTRSDVGSLSIQVVPLN